MTIHREEEWVRTLNSKTFQMMVDSSMDKIKILIGEGTKTFSTKATLTIKISQTRLAKEIKTAIKTRSLTSRTKTVVTLIMAMIGIEERASSKITMTIKTR